MELFFLFKPDGSYAMGPPPPDMPKDVFVGRLKESIRQNQFFGVVHILEAWVYIPRRLNDPAMKKLEASEMKVADLKREDRAEALVVRYESRDGAQRLWINQILRTKNSVALADAVEMGDEASGRFGSLF